MVTKSPSEFRRWLVVMSSALLFFYTFIQINMMNSISTQLMQHFHINAAQLGTLSALYFWANFLLVFPAGLILDRFSTRKVLMIVMIIAVISMFMFALSNTYYLLSASRLLGGFAGAFCIIIPIRLASRWFKPTQMALVTGCVVTLAMIGGMVAQTPLVILSKTMGWQHAIFAGGILGILFLMLIWLFVQDQPADYKISTQENVFQMGFWRSIGKVVLNRNNWFAGLYTGLMNLPIFLLGALWGTMFLTQADHLTNIQASYVASMLFLGAIIGSPLMGWISDHLSRRRSPMIFGAVFSLLVMLLIIYGARLNFIELLVLFFALGLITSMQVISYPLVVELNSPSVTGSATSIISISIMFLTFIFQPLFGYLMDLHWHATYVHQMPVYSVQNFRDAMLILIISFVVSLCMAILLPETKCQPRHMK